MIKIITYTIAKIPTKLNAAIMDKFRFRNTGNINMVVLIIIIIRALFVVTTSDIPNRTNISGKNAPNDII